MLLATLVTMYCVVAILAGMAYALVRPFAHLHDSHRSRPRRIPRLGRRLDAPQADERRRNLFLERHEVDDCFSLRPSAIRRSSRENARRSFVPSCGRGGRAGPQDPAPAPTISY